MQLPTCSLMEKLYRLGTRILPSIILFLLVSIPSMTQVNRIQWSDFPTLPDQLGFAGMYAGASSGAIIVMGGANFPNSYPWEGGVKKWYDHIYIMPPGGEWQLSSEKLPLPAGYGISVVHNDKVIVAGGCNGKKHLSDVFSYQWKHNKLIKETLPALPTSLAYMTGALVGNTLIILGGAETPDSPPSKTALLLDLQNPTEGWHTLDSWPGPERILPVSGVWKDQLFLMSGETTGTNPLGEKYRAILHDNYSLSVNKSGTNWIAKWQKLSPIPRGISAGGTLPLINGNAFVIWGGVDAVTAQYRTPATHPGITKSVLLYDPEKDMWEFLGDQNDRPARVTLPVIPYQDSWLYVSGEIKPGIRTPGIVKIK